MSIWGFRSTVARSLGVAGLALACLAGGGTAAFASNDGDVDVGGEHILTVRFAADGMTVKQRADAVTERLVTILADPDLNPEDIVALPVGSNGAKIMVKTHLLVTVDLKTARFNHMKPMALAQAWLGHLRDVLPEINAQPNPNDRSGGHAKRAK